MRPNLAIYNYEADSQRDAVKNRPKIISVFSEGLRARKKVGDRQGQVGPNLHEWSHGDITTERRSGLILGRVMSGSMWVSSRSCTQ